MEKQKVKDWIFLIVGFSVIFLIVRLLLNSVK